MIKSPEIEAVCQEISEISVDYNRIVDRYTAAFPDKKRISLQDLLKHFSEIHLDLSLEAIAQKTGIMISKTPLPKTETARCTYAYDSLGRLYVKFKCSSDGQEFEYDSVVTVNGVPVDFEISIISPKGNNGKRKVDTRGRLTADFYKRKLSPLKELFDSDVGYVFISPIDVYRILNEPSRLDAVAFKTNNGLLVPLPFAKDDFMLGVCRVAREKNIAYHNKMKEKHITIQNIRGLPE